MEQEEEFYMLHYFLQRGHTLESLRHLTSAEKLVMICSMTIQLEAEEEARKEIEARAGR